jgi:hypothetical protein
MRAIRERLFDFRDSLRLIGLVLHYVGVVLESEDHIAGRHHANLSKSGPRHAHSSDGDWQVWASGSAGTSQRRSRRGYTGILSNAIRGGTEK